METPKPVEKKYFEVIVRGQYHAMNAVSGTPTLKNYEESFVLPSQEAALSTICKHLLSPRLKQVHSDFIRFRTHELVSITLKGYKPNVDVLQLDIDEMSLLELNDFCILRQLMIDPYKHSAKDIFAIREMVKKAYQTKRQMAKDMRESKASIEQTEAETLRKANGLTEAPKGVIINENEHKVTQNARAGQATGTETGPATSLVDPLDEPLPDLEKDKDLESIL